MSISTRRGDDGTTSLLYGQRVPKTHPQIEAVGALDELNVALGAARLSAGDALAAALVAIQRDLVALMGEVACAEVDAGRYAASTFTRLADADLARIDAEIVAIESRQPDFKGWATPGANPLAVALDQSRVAARRAERRMSSLTAEGRHLRPVAAHYINRLSDLLWLLAREAETVAQRSPLSPRISR